MELFFIILYKRGVKRASGLLENYEIIGVSSHEAVNIVLTF